MSSSGLPALAVNPLQFGAQANQAQAESGLAQLNLQTQTALAPLEIEAAKNKTRLSDMSTQNAALANIANQTLALDPDEQPAYWDSQMQSEAQNGNPAASQYIGHFREGIANQLKAANGDQSGAAGTTGQGKSGQPVGPDPQMLDMQVSQLPPQQLAQRIQTYNLIDNSWSKLRSNPAATADDLEAEIKFLKQNGVAIDQLLPGVDFSKKDHASYMWNYAAANAKMQQLEQNAQPMYDAMVRATARQAAGIPLMIPRNIIKTDAGIFEVNPYAPAGTPAIPLARTPSYDRTNAVDKFGRPILADKYTGNTIAGNPADPNAPSATPISAWAAQMDRAENGTGNRSAKNPIPGQTATGNGQFTEATWLQTAKAALPDVVQGMSDAQILQMRRDPAFSQEMTAAYAKANGAKLVADGQPVNGTTLALAHRFGPDGATKILDAAPDAPLETILPPAVIKANPDLKGQTAGNYARSIASQFGVAPVDIGIPVPNSPSTLSPEERELQTKQLPAQFEKAQESYESAQNLKLQLANMQDQLGQLGSTGFLAPGTGDTARLGFAKKVNSLASAMGISDKNLPFSPTAVASGEDIVKGTTRLGFDLARQLGSREAMMIVQQAVGAVPGLENTPRGAKLIFGALNTAAQRQSDYYEYLQNWAQTHPNTLGADVAFNKAYPVQHYTNMALLAAVPPSRVQYLKANPKAAKDFDAYYGKGLSSVVLGNP